MGEIFVLKIQAKFFIVNLPPVPNPIIIKPIIGPIEFGAPSGFILCFFKINIINFILYLMILIKINYLVKVNKISPIA